MRYTTEVDVEVDASEFSDEELIDELEARGKKVFEDTSIVSGDQFYYWLRDQKDVPQFVKDWCWQVLGRVL